MMTRALEMLDALNGSGDVHMEIVLGQKPELRITRIIQEWQEEPDDQWDSLVS